MCKILMTVSAEAEEKTEPNRAQKRRDLSFMSFKGDEAFVNANWHELKKEASQKETKTDTFPKKIIVWKWRENYQERRPEKTNDSPRKIDCLGPNLSGRKGEPKARSNIDTFLHPRVQKADISLSIGGGLQAFRVLRISQDRFSVKEANSSSAQCLRYSLGVIR